MHRNFSFPLLHCYSAMDVLQMQMQHCNIYQNNQDLSLPSGSDILPIYWSCRASAIYDLPINLRYIHKRVPSLVRNHPDSRLPWVNPTRTTGWNTNTTYQSCPCTHTAEDAAPPELTQRVGLKWRREICWGHKHWIVSSQSDVKWHDMMSRCWCLRCFWWTLRAWCLTCKSCGVRSKSFCCLVKHCLCC